MDNTELLIEENVQEIPKEKFYTLNQIMIATVLGGPIAGGYLMYQNYNKIGEEEGAKSIIIWSMVCTYFLFGTLILLPESITAYIPRMVIPWMNGAIAYYIAKKYQYDFLNEHEVQHGSFYKVWRSLWLGIVCALVTVIMIIPLVFFLSPFINL